MDLAILLVIGLLFIIGYSIYILFKNAALTRGVIKINVPNTNDIPAEKMDIAGNDIYYDGWLFIIAGGTGSADANNIFITRELSLSLKGTTLKVLNPNNSNTEVAVITTDFPLGKWVYFAVRYKSNVLEVYLNGKLIKTIFTTTNIISATSKDTPLKIGNSNVNGYLTKLRRLISPPDSNKIWESYLEGNGQFVGLIGSILNYFDNYDAVLSVYQDNVKTREQKLF